jgi:hypothetical protein
LAAAAMPLQSIQELCAHLAVPAQVQS